MTTAINDIADFIRIIREHPEWADAVRSVLLSQELLELPQRFAEHAVVTDRRLERLETVLADFIESTNRRLAALETGQEELKAGQEELKAGQAELKAGQEEHGRRLERLEYGQTELRRNLGPLRGFYALSGALRETRRMARIVNCRQVALLNDDDLHDMLRANDTSDIPPNEQESFEDADIVIIAENRDTGETHYIAVEVSFTAHEDDTSRAARNAIYLNRFTGQPAHAMVAAAYVSPDVEHIFASEQVRFCEIKRRHLDPD